MSRPKRTFLRRLTPRKEGSLGLIFEHFLEPLMRLRDTDRFTHQEWAEWLFGIKDREIRQYMSHKAFTMPGLYLLAPLQPVQGLGYRDVGIGEWMWVRHDVSTPDIVHVEWAGGVGSKEQVFQLSQREWESIERWLQQKDTPH